MNVPVLSAASAATGTAAAMCMAGTQQPLSAVTAAVVVVVSVVAVAVMAALTMLAPHRGRTDADTSPTSPTSADWNIGADPWGQDAWDQDTSGDRWLPADPSRPSQPW